VQWLCSAISIVPLQRCPLQREEFRKRILDRAARKKSPPLMILERISEMDDGEMEPEDSDSGGGETDGEASMGYSTVSMQGKPCYYADGVVACV